MGTTIIVPLRTSLQLVYACSIKSKAILFPRHRRIANERLPPLHVKLPIKVERDVLSLSRTTQETENSEKKQIEHLLLRVLGGMELFPTPIDRPVLAKQ